MKRLGILAMSAMCLVGMAQAVVITQWNFNSVPPDASTSTGSIIPSTGTGTASLVGGVTATFASGASELGSSDPAATDDTGWNSTNYATTAPNKSAGVQFLVSTVGFEDIMVSFDNRHSNTGSRFLQLQITTNGTTWSDFGSVIDHNDGEFWFNLNSADLSANSAVENNANFGIRIVAAHSAAGGYVAAEPGSTFGTAGTIRYDMVTISGTTQVVPEPASLAALGIGALALIRKRRTKK